MRDYAAYVGEAHRKRFGQFFTPPDVARWMVAWVLGAGQGREKMSVFDPAFGMGAFYAQVPQGVSFSACEIDPTVLAFWEEVHHEKAVFVQPQDYLLGWGQKHQHIVCNPPYSRFQHVTERQRIHAAFAEHTGLRLAGHTNLASAFLLKSLAELDGGRLAYIMPLEFLNTGYGQLVKERLCAAGHLYAILRLDCEKALFPEVTTSVGILLYDAETTHTSVRFSIIEDREDLQRWPVGSWVRDVPQRSLDPSEKWLPLFQSQTPSLDTQRMVKLSTFGRFQRGIATGANRFFALRPSQVAALGLDSQTECAPCITKSAQVKQPMFREEDYQALLEADQPVLLLSLGTELSEGARRYVQAGEAQELEQRFLTKHRTPWYKTETRHIAPLWLGVFSRGGYKAILNRSRALHLTCFHGFQPNETGKTLVDALFLYLSSRTGREILSLSMRTYGAALDKFEPNDLNHALVPSPAFLASLSDAQIAQAVEETEGTGCVPMWLEAMFAQLCER